MAKQSNDVTGWVGWVFFAGVLMIMSGFFQAIMGLVALFKDTVYVTTNAGLVAFDYTTWGWIHLIAGLVLVAAGYSAMQGNMFGRVVGVVVAALSAIANMALLPAYPFWSLIVIAMDVFIIYALTVHGRELQE